MTIDPMPAGTLVELTQQIEGRVYPAKIKLGGAPVKILLPGWRGIIHQRTGSVKQIINPLDGWCADLQTSKVRRIGRVWCRSSCTAILTLHAERPEGHEYTYKVPRTPQQAAQVRLWAFGSFLSGDLGSLVRLGPEPTNG